MKTIVVTGSTGLIGSTLVPRLRAAGYNVMRYVRRAPSAEDEVYWSPAEGEIDPAPLDGAAGVIHLAGENIAAQRWTEAQKTRLLESREQGTALLSRAAAACSQRPDVLLTASAIGYYGADRGDAELTEASEPGDDFLAEICKRWEQATAPARDAGMRVVHTRFGLVLSSDGGLLGRLLPLFRCGLGGRLASGRQWMSWVGIDDAVGSILFLLSQAEASGAFNVVAPQAVRNAEFTKSLAAAVRRPALFPVPGFALKLVMGSELADVALGSVKVVPEGLTQAGYRFTYPELESYLQATLA